MTRLGVFSTGVLLVVSATAGAASPPASDYPNRPLRIVAPFPAGGTVDIVARLVGQRLTAAFGQQVVVDNRPGAGGIIGTDIVAKATPDGHTLLLVFMSHAVNPHVYRKLPYDTVADFAPIAMLAITPNVVVVNPAIGAGTVKEFVAYAQKNAGKVNYASAGIGTNSHLAAEMLNVMAGIRLAHVPYKGAPQANADLIAGAVHVHIPSIPTTLPFIKAARLKAIGVTSVQRAPVLPEVATVAETLPGYEALTWYALAAPAGTPRSIIDRLSREVISGLKAPEMAAALSSQGADPAPRPPAETVNFIQSELDRWGKVARGAGIQPQ